MHRIPRVLAIALASLAGAGVAVPALADPPAADPAAMQPEAVDAPPAVAPDADIYVYPTKGQSEKQLDRDRYECHNWAVAQSHYNPSDPHLAPHQQIQVVEMPAPGRDTAVGAVTGAVIGSSVGGRHDNGGATVAGAIVGAMIGGASDAARQRAATQQVSTRVSAEAEAERAKLERQASDYRRAISACLEGRGYTVK
ncbi:MAG TPA: glycine zipper 2TM domain-containing protein [Steroidobacteraceae bacterium]|nr:glycine zipper 2TM domain-containing protein [Steroidobacteraceae bacterium]